MIQTIYDYCHIYHAVRKEEGYSYVITIGYDEEVSGFLIGNESNEGRDTEPFPAKLL